MTFRRVVGWRHTAPVNPEEHPSAPAPVPAPPAPTPPPAIPGYTPHPVLPPTPPVYPGGIPVPTPPRAELASFMPHVLGGLGVLGIFIAMFAPLASSDNPADTLRTTDLHVMTPILGLIALVVATGVMCGNARFLAFGRGTAPLVALVLTAAVGGEIFDWGGRVPDESDVGLAYMVSGGMYFLMGGILLLGLAVLPMRPATPTSTA